MAENTANPGVRWIVIAPLALFLVLAVIFFVQLQRGGANSTIPSALIGKQAPTFELAALEGLKHSGEPVPSLKSTMFEGKVSVVNVWASWCVPCRQEHPVISEIGKDDRIQLTGINYKDKTENALRFLGSLGNPFKAVGVDPRGKVSIDWGVYGIPETFLVGRDGSILYKHVGPMDVATYREKFMPEVEKALAN